MRCDAFRVETRHRILLVNRGPQSAALRGHGIQKAIRMAIRPQTIRPFRAPSSGLLLLRLFHLRPPAGCQTI